MMERKQDEMPGALIIISGPSGVGKTTICKQLVRRLDAFLSVSVTTRREPVVSVTTVSG